MRRSSAAASVSTTVESVMVGPAQARVFLGRLREEIETLSRNIENARALVEQAQKAGRFGLGDRLLSVSADDDHGATNRHP
ncbi:hypothetical protein ACFWAY_49285 [Rhodococcus sp. NPDC059968]|uniref:hypothetical protein n=1 Tax=Rhodococcus sp. NPDC059968 TaxID=3347017 RepID=UPI0036733E4D